MSAVTDVSSGRPSRTNVARPHSGGAAGYMLAAPAFFLILALFILPMLSVFAIATTDWQFGAKNFNVVGLANFRELFADPTFAAALENTMAYVLMTVPATVCLGLGLALLIESRTSLRAFYQAIHFLPFMATLAAMAVVWEAMLHPTVGLVNQLLSCAGFASVNWLRNESTVLPVLAAIGVWQNLGFAMVLFLAGLKQIPQDLYDAAAIDGATATIDRLVTVTLPSLGPVTMFVVIVIALRAFEVFDTVQILTKGGPGHASDVLLHALYRESFEYLRTGYGAAITVVFLAFAMTLTLLQARVIERKVHYQ